MCKHIFRCRFIYTESKLAHTPTNDSKTTNVRRCKWWWFFAHLYEHRLMRMHTDKQQKTLNEHILLTLTYINIIVLSYSFIIIVTILHSLILLDFSMSYWNLSSNEFITKCACRFWYKYPRQSIAFTMIFYF